jgi:serine/threonine protein kinase
MEKGTSILHYEILDKLGEGGMGVVYKAQDTKLDRTVALKFLPSHLTRSDKDKKRFIREAKAAAALNHSNICTIYSVEEHEGQHFISMEFIDGQTLREKLEAEEITPEKALEYSIQIAGALADAHEKGIVHRDIKPGNIMVDSKNRIKVMDFGLAKLVDSTPITQTGTTLGTMACMAPEQIQGRPVDHRADLFSFGVLLFEMLTGQRPFGGQYDAALSYAIVNEEPQLLSEFIPNAPQKLSLLVNRLLEKDPAKRYSDSEQLVKELKACLDAFPETVTASQVMHSVTTNQIESLTSGGSSSITINFPILRSRKGLLSLGAVVIVLALISYWVFSSLDSVKPIENAIAVLPLESMSSEPDDIQFTKGVHEELINRLAGISELKVIARSSVLGYVPGERNLQDIGQDLGVSSIMEGTVRQIGDQLRVSVQLIDVNSLSTM